jgi:ribosomal protein S17
MKTSGKTFNGVIRAIIGTRAIALDVTYKTMHSKYKKYVVKTKRLYASSPVSADTYTVGERVTIVESKPLSKLIRWRVIK